MNLFGNTTETSRLIKDMFALNNSLPSWATTSLVRYTGSDDEMVDIDYENRLIHFLAPGLTLKDIDVQVEGRVLTVSTIVSAEKTSKFVRSFTKSFTLGSTVNPDSISAKLKAGILTLSYSCDEDTKSTKVKIVEE